MHLWWYNSLHYKISDHYTIVMVCTFSDANKNQWLTRFRQTVSHEYAAVFQRSVLTFKVRFFLVYNNTSQHITMSAHKHRSVACFSLQVALIDLICELYKPNMTDFVKKFLNFINHLTSPRKSCNFKIENRFDYLWHTRDKIIGVKNWTEPKGWSINGNYMLLKRPKADWKQ